MREAPSKVHMHDRVKIDKYILTLYGRGRGCR